MSVDEALERILASVWRLPGEAVAVEQTLNRVLAGDLRAEINLPPFANSSMDGYAVRASDVGGATPDQPARLQVAFDLPAGVVASRALLPGEAARIMTGAPLPEGADAVVPVEQTDSRFDVGEGAPLPAQVQVFKPVGVGDYVRPAGEDIAAGQTILHAGTVVRAAEIGVLAALGQANVRVVRQPRVAILSTGDELVSVDAPLTPGKIRDSNSYTLAALIATYGGAAVRLPPARDTLEDVRRVFHEALDAAPDVVLSSAGVSVGAFDVVRAVLDELGEVNFWRVNLRPGKPLAYGHVRGIPFFGLPGNPVSAMVTFDVFVRPVLLRLGGRPDAWPIIRAVVGEDLASDGRRSYLRVTLSRVDGRWVARSTGTQSSGALSSMLLADGLLIVPEGMRQVHAGMELDVRLLRSLQEQDVLE